MKQLQTMITDLNFDVLKCIMIFVAGSSDGAESLVKTISACRIFMKVAEDVDVLKSVVFGNVRLSGRYGLFQEINGLLSRCARAGNASALYMLSKIILVSSCQLVATERERKMLKFSFVSSFQLHQTKGNMTPKDDCQVASFLAHFMPDQACSSQVSCKSLVHFELVQLFLRKCSPHDLAEMNMYFRFYLSHFIKFIKDGFFHADHSIKHMFMLGDRLLAFEELEKLKDKLDNKVRAMQGLSAKNMESNAYVEEMKHLGATLLKTEMASWAVGLQFEEVLGANNEDLNKIRADMIESFKASRQRAISAFNYLVFECILSMLLG